MRIPIPICAKTWSMSLHPKISVLTGDITQQRCDIIVNAANSTLLGGSGVDGAIHAAGGPKILAACQKLRETRFPMGLPTGQAVETTAGNLPARYVIHTVGPIYEKSPNPNQELTLCYENCLDLMVELECKSIAFPAISTGVYGFPKEKAYVIAHETIEAFLKEHDTLIHEIRLVFFSEKDSELFLKTPTH